METRIATPKPGDRFLNDAKEEFVVLKKTVVQEQQMRQVMTGYGYQNQTTTVNVDKWLCRNIKTGKEGHWSMKLGTAERPLLVDKEGLVDRLNLSSLTALSVLGFLGYLVYKRNKSNE